MNLRTPGPTPLPDSVRQALAQDMINHRGPEFAAILREVEAGLKAAFKTENDVLILTGSGTGGLEAAVANLLSPGEPTLVVSIGFFGQRFAQIARAFGADARLLEFPWGQAADPERVAERLAAEPDVRTVFVTHNETSTGVTNDLAAIARVVKSAGRLLVVDAVSSLGCIPFETDAWGCDVVITASQKGWMVPPGLAMVSVSPAAWEAHARARMPRVYWDFSAARKYAQRGQTPWTPAISLFYALRDALRLIEAEGLENVFARHRRVAELTRSGLRDLGLELFADPAHASDTVTSFLAPAGWDAKQLVRRVREQYGVVLAGGQGPLESKVARIGHLGFVHEEEIRAVLEALAGVLAAGPVAASA